MLHMNSPNDKQLHIKSNLTRLTLVCKKSTTINLQELIVYLDRDEKLSQTCRNLSITFPHKIVISLVILILDCNS